MRKTHLVAIATAALVLAGVGGWVASTPQASVVAPPKGIDIMQLTMGVNDIATQDIHDFTFVFR